MLKDLLNASFGTWYYQSNYKVRQNLTVAVEYYLRHLAHTNQKQIESPATYHSPIERLMRNHHYWQSPLALTA